MTPPTLKEAMFFTLATILIILLMMAAGDGDYEARKAMPVTPGMYKR
jgi:hypothetical protein